MKKTMVWLSMVTFSFFATMQVAEAKRFGGGGSYGYSKKMAPKSFKQDSKPASQPGSQAAGKAPAAAGAQASGASRFLGPLAGIAAGGLLAAMLFGDGFDGIQLLDILLIALVAFLIFAFIRRRRAQASHPAGYAASGHAPVSYEPTTYDPTSSASAQKRQMAADSAPSSSESPSAYVPHSEGSMIGADLSPSAEPVLVKPDWFDEAGFIEQAKSHFVAVQQAWDALDAKELRDYCTPELFEALQAEMSQLQFGTNHTEVDELYAEMADMAIEGDYFVVSVRFSGFIKEDANDEAHAFHEIWHIRRLAEGRGNWQIAGIQQNAEKP